MTEKFRPMLLLAMPQLQDPNFERSVILLSDFLPDGAFGLVLNRPSGAPASAVAQLEPPAEKANDMPLFVGGPVAPERGWILVNEAPEDESREIVEGIYLSSSPALLRRVLETHPPPRARVLAGHAGWGPGQLDAEIAESAWLMCDADLDLVFDVEPAAMWEAAIRRIGADPSILHVSRGVH
ncbi:MAG TPA: YqgE/AlgH family protein [Terriglobia bacterium]|nr:YqgE/AlgH family protein [Terriglobia bacterium]